jgi:ankyrin repeat protein
MEKELWIASAMGDEEAVRRILQEHPEVNVNWQDESATPIFQKATQEDHAGVAALLLAHPGFDVNQKDLFGGTPFLVACYYGATSVARLLLKDLRTKNFNEPESQRSTPLWYAAKKGHLDLIMVDCLRKGVEPWRTWE